MKAVNLTGFAFVILLCTILQPANAQTLAVARSFEVVQNFGSALEVYKEWMTTDQATGADKRYVKIKLPVLEEAVRLGGGGDLVLYLDALSARANQDIPAALALLNQLLANYPNSRLRDDSRYLIGYILLMDQFDFSAAGKAMAGLQNEFPDSTYFDSALYSQAIAEEQQGNSSVATELFTKLRQRHTAHSITVFDFVWPKDQLVSRYWFSRSNDRLKIIKLARVNATSVVSKTAIKHDKYRWRVLVSSAGKQYTLLLKPGSIVEESQLSEAAPDNSGFGAVEVLVGVVEGEADSWVRITIQGKALSGVISISGYRQPLMAAATDSSLGYYNRLLRSDIDGNASSQHADVLRAPPPDNAIDQYLRSIQGSNYKTDQLNGVSHVARLGIVIDSQFNAYHSGRGFHKALSILNTTDGIFREEFGIAIHIERVIVIADRDNDPMKLGRTTMVKMMRNFRRYRSNNAMLGDDIGLATLFTGNKNTDLPLGLAWIGTACRTDGYDVSVVTPFSHSGLLSTHEIAHSMGASHDYETTCGEGRQLMSRSISRQTKDTFSSCSRRAVASYLANSSCHAKPINLN